MQTSVLLVLASALAGAVLSYRRELATTLGIVEWKRPGGVVKVGGPLAILGMSALALSYGMGGFGGIVIAGGGAGGPPAVAGTPGTPGTPVLDVAVLEGDTTVTLSTSAFNGAGEDTHASSDWWITRAANTDTVWEDFASDSLELWTAAGITGGAGLVADSPYVAFARHNATAGGPSAVDSVEFTATFSNPDLLDLDFEGYANTTELRDDVGEGNTFTNEDSNISRIELVSDAPPGYTQSMRFTYDVASPSQSMTVGRNVNLASVVTEVWVETWLKWSDNFNLVDPDNFDGQADHKVLFGRFTGTGRFEFKVGEGGFGENVSVGYPDVQGLIVGAALTASDLYVGEWFRLRHHWKVGTSGNGEVHLWVSDPGGGGDTLVKTVTGVSTNAGSIYGLALGRNQDDRDVSDLPMYLYWGPTKAWSQDPGW